MGGLVVFLRNGERLFDLKFSTAKSYGYFSNVASLWHNSDKIKKTLPVLRSRTARRASCVFFTFPRTITIPHEQSEITFLYRKKHLEFYAK